MKPPSANLPIRYAGGAEGVRQGPGPACRHARWKRPIRRDVPRLARSGNARASRPNRVLASLVAGVLAFLSTELAVAEEKRVALIVGNSKYRVSTTLKNPVKDAAAMQVALHALNFDMIVGQDLNFAAFQEKVREFTIATRNADIALLFYAGHGIQYKDQNYLLPTDVDLKTEKDVVATAIPLNKILEDMGRTAKASIVFLDACRDSPDFRSVSRGPSPGGGLWDYLAGLARIPHIPGDRFVGYAAAPGTTASDGTGRNSPFTTALLRHIGTPDLEIGTMFTAVRRDVLKATRGAQHPEALGALQRPLYLKTANALAPNAPLEPLPPPEEESSTMALLLESELWFETRDTTDPKNFEDYLRRYPTGRFASLAKKRIEQLKLAAAKTTAAARPVPPEQPAEEGDFVVATGVARITKFHSKEEAQRSAQALARARAIVSKLPTAGAGLPRSIESSAEAADMLGYMGRGITHHEVWTFHPAGAKEVRVELKAKVRLLPSELDRKLTGQIEPAEVVAGQPYRLKINAKKDANIGVFAWQANGTVVRLYPENARKPVLVKGGTAVSFPRPDDPYPAIASANMPGEQRNHEALVVVTGAGNLKFDQLAPDAIARTVQHFATEGTEFLSRLAAIPDAELEVLVLPYEVRADR
jgi:hypothetical protein